MLQSGQPSRHNRVLGELEQQRPQAGRHRPQVPPKEAVHKPLDARAWTSPSRQAPCQAPSGYPGLEHAAEITPRCPPPGDKMGFEPPGQPSRPTICRLPSTTQRDSMGASSSVLLHSPVECAVDVDLFLPSCVHQSQR
jgi:hypothetical protein